MADSAVSESTKSEENVNSVEVAAGRHELLSVEKWDEHGVERQLGATEEWFAALDHFRSKKEIETNNGTLANIVAQVASVWAQRHPWVKSIFVLLGKAAEVDAVLTLLISVDDSKSENSWQCSQFALLVGGHSGHAVQTCILEEDVIPQAGYIHSYMRHDAKSQTAY